MKTAPVRLAAALALLACLGWPMKAFAEQQLWAAAYVNWRFADAGAGIGVAQDIWIPEPATASFFTLNWDFENAEGGYIGLQSDEAGRTNARFSIWNAGATRGDSCRDFDGEGEGKTCVIPVEIERGGVYRVRVTRAEADGQGQWWEGWLEEPGGEQRLIGAIRVRRQHREIAADTLHNFSEFWGDALPRCGEVPLSVAAFGAPSLWRLDGAIAQGRDAEGTRPEENACATGRETIGAAITHAQVTLRGTPAMLVALGGTPANNQALAVRLSRASPAP